MLIEHREPGLELLISGPPDVPQEAEQGLARAVDAGRSFLVARNFHAMSVP